MVDMFAPLIFAVAAAAGSPAPPSAAQYYAQALKTMEHLPAPKYVQFETQVQGHGINVYHACKKGTLDFFIGWGGGAKPQDSWTALYEPGTQREIARAGEGETCGAQPAILLDSPTFDAADVWLRYGLFGEPPAPRATPVATPASAIKTIATLEVAAPGAYRVTDMGALPCPSGSPGHALHLVPRYDAANHPLRDVIVETQTMRFCMMRFDLGTSEAAGSGFKGDMRIDFGDVHGAWMVTGGHAVFALRLLGFAVKSGVVDYHYSNVSFPQTPQAILTQR
jgi:hypothetical protein